MTGRNKAIRIAPYFFVAPVLLYLLAFRMYPIIMAFVMSGFEWDMLSPAKFVGLGNYVALFRDPEFIRSFKVTIQFVVMSCPPRLILGLVLALALNQRFRGRKWYRLAYFVPITMSEAVMAITWKFMFHPTFGVISAITNLLGFRVNWLTDRHTAMAAMSVAVIWSQLPLYIVLYLAALQDIPEQYYEAAKVDGASPLAMFWHITLPVLKPTHAFAITMSILASMKVFSPFFMITRGGPAGATNVLGLFAYDNAFKYLRMGYASAVAVVMFLFMLVMTVTMQRRMFQIDGA